MRHPEPHSRHCPVRILFVLAYLDADHAALVQMLVRHLDPARYRIDVMPCDYREGVSDYAKWLLDLHDIDVDCVPYERSFEDTIAYLSRKLSGYELVISCQDVADIYPALEGRAHRPPLIEYGRSVAEALSGPKHFTCGYIAASEAVWAAAVARMLDARQVTCLPPVTAPAAAIPLWIDAIEAALAQTPQPPRASLFKSFLMGGFECSTHRLRTGKRLDVIAAIGHDQHAYTDYMELKDHGILALRDGLRWHLIEQSPGRYDFSSFTPMLEAANRAGVQVAWDLLHYGWPDHIDLWGADFASRFAAFARACARHVKDHSDAVPFWCPVNEISYFSWAGGDVGYLNPFAHHRGFELKVQLARASIAAIRELRDIDPRARLLQCEPGIAIHFDSSCPYPRVESEALHEEQYQANDLLSGRLWPQIGGAPEYLDIIGVNYYMYNQRFHGGPQIDVDHPGYRPLSDILVETYARYGRPVIISETGIEDERRAHWFSYVVTEVARARRRGVPVEGLCLYPVADHPGWDDDRLCPNGLLGHSVINGQRGGHPPLTDALRAATKTLQLSV